MIGMSKATFVYYHIAPRAKNYIITTKVCYLTI